MYNGKGIPCSTSENKKIEKKKRLNYVQGCQCSRGIIQCLDDEDRSEKDNNDDIQETRRETKNAGGRVGNEQEDAMDDAG